jgi:putative spermidine/putrescine transport system permease protein
MRPGSPGALPAAIVVGGLSAVSLVGLVSRSLRPGAIVGGEFGAAAWTRVLSDPAFGDAVRFTFTAALIATVVAVAIAVPLGLALRGKWTRAVMGVLVPVPHLVVAATTVAWFGPGRILDRLVGEVPIVGDQLGIGVIVVYVVKEVPFLVLLIVAALDGATNELDEAAQSLGATWRHRWRYIIGPRLAWPLGFGALIVAAFVVGSTEVPLVIGPLRPDAITTYGLNATRIRGPIARADAAVALTMSAFIVAVLAAGAAAVLTLAKRQARR